MIIKGQARSRARQLAAHLLRADQNERIQLYECRGTLALDVEGALIEMEARGVAGRTQSPLYHASISPEAATPLKDAEVRQAADLLEERLGLRGQPRIIVLHRKKERDHIHVVWSRIDASTGTSVPYSWNYRVHESVARELEALFGHSPLHNSLGLRRSAGARRAVKDYELRQAERSGVSIESVSTEITTLWHASRDGAEFQCKLQEAGYALARGDRRVFVVIDKAGGVHSLARRIQGVDTATVRARLLPLDLNELPSVADARASIQTPKPAIHQSASFAAAAMEITLPAADLHNRLSALPSRLVTVLGACRNFAHIARPHDISRVPTKPIRLARSFGRRVATSFRATRSLLIAEYASKIAAARCHAPREELDAMLAALYSERQAALNALTQRQKGDAQRQRQSLDEHPTSHTSTARAFRLRPKGQRRGQHKRP